MAELSLSVTCPLCSAGSESGSAGSSLISLCVATYKTLISNLTSRREKKSWYILSYLDFPQDWSKGWLMHEVWKIFRLVVCQLSSPDSNSPDFHISSWRTAFLASFRGEESVLLGFSPGCILGWGGRGSLVWVFSSCSVDFEWSLLPRGQVWKNWTGQ